MFGTFQRIHVSVLAGLVLLGSAVPDTSWQPQVQAHPFRLLPTPAPVPFHPWHHYYYRPYPYPYYPGYINPYPYAVPFYPDPSGDYLRGAADVIKAQGEYLKSVQQAYQLQEQVKQAQIETRRKAQEQWLWEKSNLPTFNEIRERNQREELRRSLNNPPVTELWAGKSLNDILAALQELRSKGQDGPAVPLSADQLRSINVAPARGPDHVALLKEDVLSWPVVLRGLAPQQQTRTLLKEIDTFYREARRQALAGRVDPGLLNELSRNVTALRENLVSQVSEYSFSEYTEAKRYLRQLEDAVTVLRQGDAGNWVSGKYAAQGATVKDLINYLTENGLRFAPAGGGEEAAYAALHQMLVQYHQGASGNK